ncbi:MAG: PQ-loop domain-containing transporter [Panacibacter sp.]
MAPIEILGLVAGTITSITFLPQVVKIWQTKSAKDLSIMML